MLLCEILLNFQNGGFSEIIHLCHELNQHTGTIHPSPHSIYLSIYQSNNTHSHKRPLGLFGLWGCVCEAVSGSKETSGKGKAKGKGKNFVHLSGIGEGWGMG